MSSTPVGIAMLGAGIFAKDAHLPALAALGSEKVVLKAVYSRSKSSASTLAEFAKERLGAAEAIPVYSDDGSQEGGLDTLLSRSDIQAVIVVLPLTQQPEIVIRALAAGKNVLSEKPVAKDVKTGLSLIEKWEKEFKPKGLIWRVAENFEVEPGLVEAARKIKAGAVGTVRSFNYSIINTTDKSSKWYNTPWRTVPDYQGGFLLDGGVHHAAALRVILPFSLGTSTVSGIASLTRDYLKPHDTIQAVIQSETTLKQDVYPPHGIFELSFSAPPGYSRNVLTVTGTDGNLTLTITTKAPKEGDEILAKASPFSKKGENGEQLVPHYRVSIISGDDGSKVEEVDIISSGVVAEIEGFINAIGGQDDGNGEPRGALQDVAFIEACLQSQGRPLDLKKLLSTGNA
ncbi:oxidoreductase family protein [Ceratobasidium sp. AG-I]|nr:oxidoreductase family protein [Ceratobasidium sp. AG-I]